MGCEKLHATKRVREEDLRSFLIFTPACLLIVCSCSKHWKRQERCSMVISSRSFRTHCEAGHQPTEGKCSNHSKHSKHTLSLSGGKKGETTALRTTKHVCCPIPNMNTVHMLFEESMNLVQQPLAKYLLRSYRRINSTTMCINLLGLRITRLKLLASPCIAAQILWVAVVQVCPNMTPFPLISVPNNQSTLGLRSPGHRGSIALTSFPSS